MDCFDIIAHIKYSHRFCNISILNPSNRCMGTGDIPREFYRVDWVYWKNDTGDWLC